VEGSIPSNRPEREGGKEARKAIRGLEERGERKNNIGGSIKKEGITERDPEGKRLFV